MNGEDCNVDESDWEFDEPDYCGCAVEHTWSELEANVCACCGKQVD